MCWWTLGNINSNSYLLNHKFIICIVEKKSFKVSKEDVRVDTGESLKEIGAPTYLSQIG